MEIFSLILQIQQMSMSLNLQNLPYLREIFNYERPIIAIKLFVIKFKPAENFSF